MTIELLQQRLKKDEEELEVSLRPKYFNEYIGQKGVTDNLKVYIEAAKMQRALGPCALYGPPGSARPPLRESSQTKWGSICG